MSDLEPNPEFNEPVAKKAGRPKKVIEVAEDIEQKAETVANNAIVVVKNIAVRTEDEVKTALEHLKGHGLQINFDEFGSVTFKKGLQAESIHLTSSIKDIVNTAERIARGIQGSM